MRLRKKNLELPTLVISTLIQEDKEKNETEKVEVEVDVEAAVPVMETEVEVEKKSDDKLETVDEHPKEVTFETVHVKQ